MTRMKAADLRLKIYKEMVGKTILDRYELLDLIGFGGMGAVFKGLQRAINRTVAIKVLPRLDPLTAARFHREAKLASRLTHSNTITVFDFGQTPDNYLFLVMEYLEGRSMRGMLKDCGAVHPNRVIHITSQICRSLSEAHGQGIVHRDIKPDNVYLIHRDDDPDFVKVLDFGIAKVLAGDDYDADLTAAGRIVGTPRYMAPEQVMSLPVDHRADIYAVGVIMYQMLTGTPPFDDASTPMLMMKHAHETPLEFAQRIHNNALLDMIPAGLEAIVMKALSKRPDDRHHSIDALRNELELIRASLASPHEGGVDVGNSGHSRSMQAVSAEIVREVRDPSNPTFPSAPSVDFVQGGVVARAQESHALAVTSPTPRVQPPADTTSNSRWGLLAVGLVVVVLLLIGIAGGIGALVASTALMGDKDEPAEIALTKFEDDDPEGNDLTVLDRPAPRTITIQSSPSEAEIYLDERFLGLTPKVLTVPEDRGSITYSVKKKGFISVKRVLSISSVPEEGLQWVANLEASGVAQAPDDSETKVPQTVSRRNRPRRAPRKKAKEPQETKVPKPDPTPEATAAPDVKKRKPKIELLGGDDAKPKVDALE